MDAAIFDMDGLLIDSEPLWQDAEIAVFGELGISLTRDLCRETMGVRLDEVVRHWYEKHPWQGPSLGDVEERIVGLVGELMRQRGAPMPGVNQAIAELRGAGYRLAVASSSPMRLIRIALEQLQIIDQFEVLHSAENESHGKPHPAVYSSTMTRLGIEPGRCIAFEDSVAGVRSAKDAGAQVIAVPDQLERSHPGFAIADRVIDSLAEFSLELVERGRVNG
ncbi:MAG: hexitol phosphatase HxpB [Woeseiaceae bacterium]|nr:hexitol phosphatase HxpB [Woeseiaceae bacterium]